MSVSKTRKESGAAGRLFGAALLTAVLIAIDQITKAAAVAGLRKQPLVLMSGVFELRYLENKGAAFGMLRDRQWVFVIFASLITLICAVGLYRLSKAGRRFMLLRITLAVLAAGALGNMIDRIARGYVVDFLYFSLIDFPVFNVADIYVCVSAAVMIILFAFVYSDDDLKHAANRKDKKK